MAVLAVLLREGLPLEEAAARLAALPGVPGRMERFSAPGQPLVVVDYAHTPDALEHALSALREHAQGRLLCLFGCGGERDRGKRPLMGALAEALADQVLLSDDNPRGEDGDAIIADILAGMRRPERASVERNRGLAIRRAIESSAPGDLVLVAGKGHETTQTSGDLVTRFSDRETVAGLLAAGEGGA
jgi:UDP-N-acetylmuramoyl-L-alanyl-D-glutamate--2,6-diaminopimelate ligase